jgi:DNA-binding transcriptional LysR family regulator
LQHQCIRIRIGDDSVYRWEFERDTEQLQVNVPGALVVDHGEIGLAAVRQGAGLFYVADPMVRQDLDQGVQRPVLDDWSP